MTKITLKVSQQQTSLITFFTHILKKYFILLKETQRTKAVYFFYPYTTLLKKYFFNTHTEWTGTHTLHIY